jgi:16S rRNA (guanine527-N7)-methyltransferase
MYRDIDLAAAPPPELHPAAVRCFGERLETATRYAHALRTDAVVRGLIGPREADRIWDRHLLNCAVVSELIKPNARVIDVGSGAGLPGIVLALARPDLSITLVEPLARRVTFLNEVVAELGLRDLAVVRARAEELPGLRLVASADVVTARAVAPLDRLATWCLPLVVAGGRLLALKGESAAAEVEAHRAALAPLSDGPPVIRQCGVGVVDPATTVVEITRRSGPVRTGGKRSSRR